MKYPNLLPAFAFALWCLTPSWAFGQAGLQLADHAVVHDGQGAALTPATNAPPERVVRTFLESRHGDKDSTGLKLTREFFAPTAKVTHVRMAQEIGGLAVYGSYVRAAVNEFGELVWMAESLAPLPQGGVSPARIGPARALDAALRELHPGLGDFDRVDWAGHTTRFEGDPAFYRPPEVTRVAIPLENGSLREGFLVETWTNAGNLLHHTLVSGEGEILRIELRTQTDSYNIFPDHPGSSSQMIAQGPGSGNVNSPIGWLDPVDHSSISITGNNTQAYLDSSTSNSPDSSRPDGSAGAVISDGNFATVADLSQEPETGANPDVAVQNLFYYCNVIHDKLYEHGFVEATGNFQDDNFGLGGVGGDPVLCEAQDGSGTDNANFSTPSDGSSGRMQMFLWTQSSPKRDGALDSDFIWHEYGHGLTWRMIGGMSGAMSGAIGEGMGDVLAILMNQNDVVGEYSFNDPLGIRSEAYEGYSRTYGDFGGSSVHFDGEIYAAIHWDLRARYLANGFTVDDQLDDIVGGMNFTPSGPDFEAMRDGILAQAPSTRDCLIWESFAKFGVGVNAQGSVSGDGPFGGGSVSITEDFSVPAACGCQSSDPACCTDPCSVECQDPQAKCQHGCADIDPDCCIDACSPECGDLNAKCTLCNNSVDRCEATCDNTIKTTTDNVVLGSPPLDAAFECPSVCADQLDEDDTVIYEACMSFWSLIPLPLDLAACDYCKTIPWPLSQACSHVCKNTPLNCTDVTAVLGDLVCCDIVQSTVVPYEVCWDFDHNKLCRETTSGCNAWYDRCLYCCEAHGRPGGGPCDQNCLRQRENNIDSPCSGL